VHRSTHYFHKELEHATEILANHDASYISHGRSRRATRDTPYTRFPMPSEQRFVPRHADDGETSVTSSIRHYVRPRGRTTRDARARPSFFGQRRGVTPDDGLTPDTALPEAAKNLAHCMRVCGDALSGIVDMIQGGQGLRRTKY